MSYELASQAMRLVQGANGNLIPEELRRRAPRDVFVFHDFESFFQEFKRSWPEFSFANGVGDTIPALAFAGECFGFAEAELNPLTRRVHVWAEKLTREPDQVGALAHEYIHCLSHPAFFPGRESLFCRNPPHGFHQVEGITEVLTGASCTSCPLNVQVAAARLASSDNATQGDWEQYINERVDPKTGRMVAYQAEWEASRVWVKKQFPLVRKQRKSLIGTKYTREEYKAEIARIRKIVRFKLKKYVFRGEPCDLGSMLVKVPPQPASDSA